MSNHGLPLSPLARALAAIKVSALDEGDAHVLADTLARRFDWQLVIFTRAEVTSHLRLNQPGGAGRELTDEEWRRVTRTAEWGCLPHLAHERIDEEMRVRDAIIAAGLECMNCDGPLHDRPTVTGRLCDECRVGPAGQAIAVDPITAGVYWLDAASGQLVYVRPFYCTQTDEYFEPEPVHWRNLEADELRRAHAAHMNLAEAAPATGCAANSPWYRPRGALL